MKYPSPEPWLYKALLEAYSNCLKNKRHVKKWMFHLQHERIIHQLALDIENRAYRPYKSNIFLVTNPKPREVIAAHLRDRIVHHFIYDYMSPYWERRFVANSYACRVGKGPLQAGKDLRKRIEAHQRGGGRPLYFLQLDIQNFFPSINLHTLYGIIKKHLENPLYLWLCHVVIYHRASDKGNFVLTSPPSRWRLLPKYKSLFRAPPHLGLGIGNLTSQFFANVYMNRLDQFIAHRLKRQFIYWQRYVDDILFLSDDKERLRRLVAPIQNFLQSELQLTLNPKKTLLQPLAHGLDHLGYWHKPHYCLVRRRVVHSCKAKIASFALQDPALVDANAACSAINSYMGNFRYAQSQHLREHMGRLVGNSPSLADKITLSPDAKKFVLLQDPEAEKKEALREQKLQDEFKENLAKTMVADDSRDQRRSEAYIKHWRPLDDIMAEAARHYGMFNSN